jgi:hypothetical protein
VTYVPYTPPRPEKHPIDRDKLEEWRKHAVVAASTDEEVDRINYFANNVRNISFEEFIKALKACFKRLKQIYPEDRYEIILQNKLKPTGNQRGNSERWLAELVNHECMYDIPKDHPTRWGSKQVVNVFIEDAIYTGDSHYMRMSGPDRRKAMPSNRPRSENIVSIVPYVTRRGFDNPLVKCVTDFFVNAETGEPLVKDEGDDVVTSVDMRGPNDVKEVRDANKMIIYFEDMGTIPFYFDHKLADLASWAELWMFRGFHTSRTGRTGAGRTVFIEGCADDDDTTEEKADHYYCPKPPYAIYSRAEK